MDMEDGRHFDPTRMLAFRKALPAILKVREEYADDKGVLADLVLSQEWLPADE